MNFARVGVIMPYLRVPDVSAEGGWRVLEMEKKFQLTCNGGLPPHLNDRLKQALSGIDTVGAVQTVRDERFEDELQVSIRLTSLEPDENWAAVRAIGQCFADHDISMHPCPM